VTGINSPSDHLYNGQFTPQNPQLLATIIVLLKMVALTRHYMVALDPGRVILGITILRLVAITQKEIG
jgi:hypothetical protein